MNKDIRWKQRFSNYKKALLQLTKFIDKGKLNELQKQGLIQAFEYTHELAWNVLKDYLQDQGIQNITGSKDFELGSNTRNFQTPVFPKKKITGKVSNDSVLMK
jgi:hypothetical protein